MPLPFLIAAGAVIGIAGHIDAKDKNERAIRKSNEAQEIYYSAKNSLEKAQKTTEESLINLGYAKKKDLDYFLNKFINCYEKIKSVEIKESVGLNEINNFNIDQQGVLEIRQMNDIYSESFSSGATGAAAGTAIALAVSGAMPVVTGSLSLAGTAFTMGEIGMAASFAGSAFSFAAAMTPLSAIAAPVIMFTGISASMKADENLEEARVMKAEAIAAAEKMKVSETLCNGIKDRSDMFLDLLNQLNGMFYESTELLIRVVNEKEKNGLRGKLTSGDFTLEEKKLIAVTKSIAGAVKAVIDTPILSKEGAIDNKADELYHVTVEQLPEYNRKVSEVRALNLIPQPNIHSTNTERIVRDTSSGNLMFTIIRNAFAMLVGATFACMVVAIILIFGHMPDYEVFFNSSSFSNSMAIGVLVFSSISIFIGDFSNNIFGYVIGFSTGISISILYSFYCVIVDITGLWLIVNALFFVLMLVAFCLTFNEDKYKNDHKNAFFMATTLFIVGYPVIFVVYALLSKLFGMPVELARGFTALAFYITAPIGLAAMMKS